MADPILLHHVSQMRFEPLLFFFSSRRRHTRSLRDWSSDVCSSDLPQRVFALGNGQALERQPVRLRSLQQFRSEEHTSELQSRRDLVCRLLLEKKNITKNIMHSIALIINHL